MSDPRQIIERWQKLKADYESVGDGGSVTHIARELLVTFSTDAPTLLAGLAAIEERDKLRTIVHDAFAPVYDARDIVNLVLIGQPLNAAHTKEVADRLAALLDQFLRADGDSSCQGILDSAASLADTADTKGEQP